jgi:hypothetical protein
MNVVDVSVTLNMQRSVMQSLVTVVVDDRKVRLSLFLEFVLSGQWRPEKFYLSRKW